ncbi:RCC1 repeat- and reductase domain-containing protein [Acrasis kona]|uniref:RCC1 repeat- and reductase domain-containing protein n=1 Tax=Acrasis kona TaxID=1008807 RepID=A0AAW2YVL3_9EUKA
MTLYSYHSYVDCNDLLPHFVSEDKKYIVPQFHTNLVRQPLSYFSTIPDEHIIRVLSGASFFVALAESGNVYTWGQSNNYGQLGRITPRPATIEDEYLLTTPHKIDAMNIKKISVGKYHTLMVDQNGKVFGFGQNCFGKLGLTDTRDKSRPELLIQLSHRNIIHASAGVAQSCCLDDEGVVWIFGWGTAHAMIKPNNLGDVLLHSGDVITTTIEQNMRTAETLHNEAIAMVPTNTNRTLCPKPVYQLIGEQVIKCETNGTIYVCLTKDGRVYTFGSALSKHLGQLGPVVSIADGITYDRNEPKQLVLPCKIKDISVGAQHTILLSEDGVPYSFGSCSFQELARPYILDRTDGLPLPVGGLPKISVVCASNYSSVFLSESNEMYFAGVMRTDIAHECSDISSDPYKVSEDDVYYEKINLSCDVSYISLHSSDLIVVGQPCTKLYDAVTDEHLNRLLGDIKIRLPNSEFILTNKAVICSRSASLRDLVEKSVDKSSIVIPVDVPLSALELLVEYIYTDCVRDVKKCDQRHVLSLALFLNDDRFNHLMINNRECPPIGNLYKNLGDLFKSEYCSDVSFKFDDGVVLRAHRCVLATKSSYFKSLLTIGMMGDDINEPIELSQTPNVTSKMFKFILQYLYSSASYEMFSPDVVCELALVANMFGLGELQEMCEESITKGLLNKLSCLLRTAQVAGAVSWEDVREQYQGEEICDEVRNVLTMAEEYNLKNAAVICNTILNQYPSAIL